MTHLLELDDLDEVDIRKDWLLTKEPTELQRAKPRTGGHDASTRHFVADFAMIGLRAAGLSPDEPPTLSPDARRRTGEHSRAPVATASTCAAGQSAG
jgi:hypothetical protein